MILFGILFIMCTIEGSILNKGSFKEIIQSISRGVKHFLRKLHIFLISNPVANALAHRFAENLINFLATLNS